MSMVALLANAQQSIARQRYFQVDDIYHALAEAWHAADADRFELLYAPDAQYPAFDDPFGNGSSAFMPGIRTFFDEVKTKGDSIYISFQVEQRRFSADSTMCYDVGYFMFVRTGSKEEKAVGKMVNIFLLQDGSWRFMVDMSEAAPLHAFTGAGFNTHRFWK